MLIKVPSLDLRSFHDDWPEADVGIIVDDRVGDVARVLNVDIVSNGGGQRERIIRHPECWLYCRVISDFGVGTHSNRVVQTINHCSKSNVTILREENVSKDGSVRGDMRGFWYGKGVLLDVKNVSVAIDWL